MEKVTMQIIPVTEHPSETDVLDDRIADLVETVRAHRERIATLEAKNDAAKEELRRLLELRGENWSDEEGYARLVPESCRVSYETKALDELIIREPLHYGWLKDYRKESTIRSSIQVK
jgi:superfamily I DNA/RNA helicase